jgi:hypothetical protein
MSEDAPEQPPAPAPSGDDTVGVVPPVDPGDEGEAPPLAPPPENPDPGPPDENYPPVDQPG